MSLSQAEKILESALVDLREALPAQDPTLEILMQGDPFSRSTYIRLERLVQYLVNKWNGPIANGRRNYPILRAVLQFSDEYFEAYTAAHAEENIHA